MEHRPLNLKRLMKTADRLVAEGRRVEAESHYREIVDTHPNHLPAWTALAFLAFNDKNLAQALAITEHCVSIEPESALSWRNLCELRRRAGRTVEAVAAGQRAVRLSPNDPEALYNLSLALGDAHRGQEAIASLRRLLELAPGHGRGWNYLGHRLFAEGGVEQAQDAFTRAAAIEPNNEEIRLNLKKVGQALEARIRAKDRFASGPDRSDLDPLVEARRLWAEGAQQSAVLILDKVIALDPSNIEALGLRAACFSDLGESEAAIADAERARAIDPGNTAVLMILSVCQLALGRWKEGWRNYESRFLGADEVRAGKQVFEKIPLPQWTGELGTERQSLLVICEQGYGDSIQFSRYLTLLNKRFARIGFLTSLPLLRLMDWSFGADVAVLSNYPIDYAGWDWHCRVMSLPFAFSTEIDAIPRPWSYLRTPEHAREYWRVRLDRRAGAQLRVGLSWMGRPTHRFDRQRSLSLERLAPLLSVEGVTFVSLQMHENIVGAPVVPRGVKWLDWMGEISDFASTAALIANLDLVLTIDSAVAHLAAALGVPVWLMNRHNSEWRWMAPREDSPWYPSMRIFRQATMGDWSDVVDRVAGELRRCRDNRLKGARGRLPGHDAAFSGRTD